MPTQVIVKQVRPVRENAKVSNYVFIRIDRGLVVPAFSTVFEPLDDGVIRITVLGAAPFVREVGGEIAVALGAFLDGSRSVQIVGNGIADIYGTWTGKLAAQRAFEPAITDVIVDADKFMQATEPGRFFTDRPNVTNTPSAVPQIDVEKVARALRERG